MEWLLSTFLPASPAVIWQSLGAGVRRLERFPHVSPRRQTEDNPLTPKSRVSCMHQREGCPISQSLILSLHCLPLFGGLLSRMT